MKDKKFIDFNFDIILMIFVGIILFGIILIPFSIYKIDAGERGVLLTFGKANENVIDAGLHFKVPFAQTIKKFEVRTVKLEIASDSASKDLQDVQTVTALNYHVDANKVVNVYKELGKDYQVRVIEPSIQEGVRAITAKYNAEELITKRPEIRDGIRSFLTDRLEKYSIVVDDFNIVNFQFSEEFDKAVELKVTAEQQKLKADIDLERIRVEKEQKITQAQAEAESLRIQKQEITELLIKLRDIEVRREAVNKWNGVLPLVTGGSIPLVGLEELQVSNSSI